VQGQDIILLITVHSAQVTGEDKTIGSARVPLRAGLQTQKWFELSSFEPNAHGGALELSISYVGTGNPHHVDILTRQSKMVIGAGMGAAEGPMENIEIPATLALPMDTESFPELSDMSEGSPLPSLPSRSPENQPRGLSPTIKGLEKTREWAVQAWAEADMYVRASETDKELPISPGETTEAAPQNTLQSNPKPSSCAPTGTPNRICLDADSYRQLETAAIPASSSQASVLKLTFLEPDAVSESASTLASKLTYDGTPANVKPTHQKMQWPQSKTSELIRSASSNSGAGTIAANKAQERRQDWEEMFEMRAEMDGFFSNARHLASPCRHLAPPGRSPGRPWSERKIGHHSQPTPHQLQTIDTVMAKLQKAELDLMVTKEELAVEQGKRIKADEACAKHLDQIAKMAEQLKEEQNTVSKLKKRVSEVEWCTSTDAVAQERRQLRFSRFLSEFVLTCLLDKLRSLCYSRSTLSESCDEQSGSYTTGQTMVEAECMKLRRECADDLKSLIDILDVMNGLVLTRDNAARYCIDRAQQSIVTGRHALSLLQHALAETEREMEGRQELQALHDDEQGFDSEKFRDSLEGVSHIQHRSVSLIQAGSTCAVMDKACLGIDSMQAQISSLIDNMSKTEHELKVLSKFFEQKDRTSNGVLASFIHSKHAGEAGWSVNASEPWGGMQKCHASWDAELSVTDHHKLIRELDSVLLAELCSSRRLQPPKNSVPEQPASVGRRQRPAMPTVQKSLPFNPTRTWTNCSEAKKAVTKNNSVDDDLPLLSASHKEGDDHVTHVLLKTGDQGVHVQEPGQGPAPTSTSQHAPRMYCPAFEDANETEAGDGERRRFFWGEAVKRTDIYDALSRKYSESLSMVPKGYAHAHFQYA
jgi:hypothetical protein